MQNPYLEKYKQQELRKCQLKQLGILQEIDALCRKHHIDYWLDGGTLLGAVRHGGFIPWDDDIDIAMRRSDLPRFIEIASRELPSHLMVQTPQNEPTKEPITKIRDLNSFYVEPGDIFSADYQKGVFVDIFPMEPHPNIPRSWMKALVKPGTRAYAILHKPHYYGLRAVAEFFWFGAKYVLCRSAYELLSLVRDKHTYFGNIFINNGYGITHIVGNVFPLTEIEFEGIKFLAPHDPRAYNEEVFRNPMQIPPVEQRKIHSVFIATRLIDEE